MCSYNLINGTHSCENNVTLGHLKSPSGLNFTGWVLSDWGGAASTVGAALAGGVEYVVAGSSWLAGRGW
jgi:beta-glucosidase